MSVSEIDTESRGFFAIDSKRGQLQLIRYQSGKCSVVAHWNVPHLNGIEESGGQLNVKGFLVTSSKIQDRKS